MKFYVVHNCRWMFWAHGMVVWPFVFLRYPENEIPSSLWRHELEHCYQFFAEGRLRFCIKYLWYHIRYGYQKNPYEVSARAKQNYKLNNDERKWLANKKVVLT